MEEAAENGKDSFRSAHISGMNEFLRVGCEFFVTYTVLKHLP
jgi:hypothetical protein